MKPAAELYPEYAKQQEDDGKFYGPSCYDPIIQALGEVLLELEDTDYQGDTFLLLKERDRYGWVVIGWGSCSGCDALQACETLADIDALAKQIEEKVQWFESKSAILTYWNKKDWEKEWFVERCDSNDSNRMGRKFVEDVRKLLSE